MSVALESRDIRTSNIFQIGSLTIGPLVTAYFLFLGYFLSMTLT